MSFVSYEFFVLFGALLALYFIISHRLQNRLLLLASYIFYGWWDWRFLILLFASSSMDYLWGFALDKEHYPSLSRQRRKTALILSVICNLGILGFFKYFNFFVESFVELSQKLHLHADLPLLKIVLPIGISFYTFQSMSYTIDIYRGELRSTKNYLDFLTFVSFFPHLVAGPIQRAANLLPQVIKPRNLTLENFYSGTQLAFYGFFLKMVIADNAATVVNATFHQSNPSSPAVILAIYAFAIQIYCDFCGYTNIAIGISRMIGFNLTLNFNLPYFATNPSDFWRRWHISLSSWLRDYLYISLGGNRKGEYRTYLNLFITMLLGGLSHWAAWHFVLWGFFHGLLLFIYRLLQTDTAAPSPGQRRMRFWLSVIFYFQLTCIGWFLFRVENMAQLVTLWHAVTTNLSFAGCSAPDLLKILLLWVPVLSLELWQFSKNDLEPWVKWPVFLRVPFYLAMFYAIVLFGTPEKNEFIYFQF